MWKVLIADDEPKIRRGLRNLVDWPGMGMEVAGEAEDGEMALEQARLLRPDIVLVDICMPFVNGLQFIEQLKAVAADCVVIVITGHDEFSYAQQALKLRVFDYLLKPVAKDQLIAVLEQAGQEASRSRSQHKYLNWASRETQKNLPLLRERFYNDWVQGKLPSGQLAEQLNFLEIVLPEQAGMLLLKVVGACQREVLPRAWDKEMLLFAVQNVLMDLWPADRDKMIFRDGRDAIVAICPLTGLAEWYQWSEQVQQTLERSLNQLVVVCQQPLADWGESVAAVYQRLTAELNKRLNCTPVVLISQKFIDTYYYKEDLSLQDVAKAVQISPAYLSRLLKQETGISFIDYLTGVGVQKAIQLMNDPAVKLYEVAELVGYSNQHYFSTAFKKVLGVSPAEYRKRGIHA
jgi:two-component system response regulator YesN